MAIGLLMASLLALSTNNVLGAEQSLPTEESALAKLTLGLDTLYEEYQQYKATAAVPPVAPFQSEQTQAQVTADNQVIIDAVAATDPQALSGDLVALGASVTGMAGNMVSAVLPIDQIPALSGLSSLLFARPAMFVAEAGMVTSQGDDSVDADLARLGYSVDGTGITVGVISGSFDCQGGAAGDVASGDLPAAGVQVLKEIANCTGGGDEGRAMAQVVHDLAPGARILFHTGTLGEASLATAIRALQAAGANIIAVDLGYQAEPFFQDGQIAQAVDEVVAKGVTFFAAAANSARKSYEAPYRPGTNYAPGAFGTGFLGGRAHDFDPGPGVDNFQRITCPPGIPGSPNGLNPSLQWDNAFPSLGGPAPTANMDFYLLNDPPTAVIARSVAVQPTADPVEVFAALCPASGKANLMIVLRNGTAPSRVKYVLFGRPVSAGIVMDEYDTQSPTIVGFRNAAGAVAVGASAYFLTPSFGRTPPALNHFSAAGGVPILFQTNGTLNPNGGILRAKPEITAPDGGDNTFFVGGPDWNSDGFPNFFGTSAAAPHAAGVAALMLQKNGSLTPAAIKRVMQSTAIDITERVSSFDLPVTLTPLGVGFDNDSGAGLINAQAALAAVSKRCDADADGDIDTNDLSLISRARGKSPAIGDPRDANGDGQISSADVQVCIKLCTRLNCAT